MRLAVRSKAGTPRLDGWLPEVLERLRIRRIPVLATSPPELWEASAGLDPELLIAPPRFPIAVRTLSALGFVEPPEQQPLWLALDRSIRTGTRLVRTDGAALEIVHHVRPWIWGLRLPFADLDQRAVLGSVAGAPIRSADRAAGVLIAALHVVDDASDDAIRRLLTLVAVTDADDVAGLARDRGLDGVVAAILTTLPQDGRPQKLIDELDSAEPAFLDALRLRGLRTGRARPPTGSALGLPAANAVALLAARVVPSPGSIERHYGSRYAYAEWWRDTFLGARERARSLGGRRMVSHRDLAGESRQRPTASDRSRARTVPARRTDRATSLFPRVGPVTTAALFHGVDGAPHGPIDPRAWDDELEEVLRQRLSGLALAHAEHLQVRLTPDTRSRLHEAHQANVARALAVESTAVKVLDVLASRSIPVVVTKGPGVAMTYPEPSLRPYGDIDVLVPSDRFTEAMTSLTRTGFEEYFDAGEPRSYFDRFCREGVNLVRPDGGSIDLHHRIPPWVWGERLTFPRLIAGSRRHDIAGGAVTVLDPMHNMLVAALHVISDRRDQPGSKLITWRDIVSLAAVCDPERVVSEARRVELDWYLAFIMRQLPRYTALRPIIDRLGTPDPRPGDAFRLRRLLPPSLGSRHQIAQVFRLPAPNAMAFLAGYVVPSRDFLAKRYGEEGGYLRWWREATGRLRQARDVPNEGSEGERG